jgi:SAM-dependent methyltransferase
MLPDDPSFLISTAAPARLRRAESGCVPFCGGAPLRIPLRRASFLVLLPILLRQACHEARLRWWRSIRFRSRRADEVWRAYRAMEPWEFEGVNARQAWANWRTIPRNLAGVAPSGPALAVDVCCGTGQSTEVLAYHLAAGSRILGLELHPGFVDVARARTYRTRCGAPARVSFRAQSVLETFRDEQGSVIRDASVDLVNSSGAVGCHFDTDATSLLAREIARVLRPGGLALIDSGRGGTDEPTLRVIFGARGFDAVKRARSCALDRYTQVCFRSAPRADQASGGAA